MKGYSHTFSWLTKKNSHTFALFSREIQFAVIETVPDRSIYRGAEADISIHNISVLNNQYCKSQIWLENGPRGQLNSIQVGWAVRYYQTGPYTYIGYYYI